MEIAKIYDKRGGREWADAGEQRENRCCLLLLRSGRIIAKELRFACEVRAMTMNDWVFVNWDEIATNVLAGAPKIKV